MIIRKKITILCNFQNQVFKNKIFNSNSNIFLNSNNNNSNKLISINQASNKYNNNNNFQNSLTNKIRFKNVCKKKKI